MEDIGIRYGNVARRNIIWKREENGDQKALNFASIRMLRGVHIPGGTDPFLRFNIIRNLWKV